MKKHVSFWILQTSKMSQKLSLYYRACFSWRTYLHHLTQHINSVEKAIIFFAEILGYFMVPFITVDMSLSKQVQYLATITFLVSALYVKHGTACLSGALYVDSQSVIKNIIFTIAQMQIIDSNLPFYLLLEGTDRLKGCLEIVEHKIMLETLTLNNWLASWVLQPSSIVLWSATQT